MISNSTRQAYSEIDTFFNLLDEVNRNFLKEVVSIF